MIVRAARISLGLLALAWAGCKADGTPAPADSTASPAADPDSSPPPANEAAGETAPANAEVLAAASPKPEPAADAPAVPAAPETPPPPPTPRKVLILGDSLAATGFGALLEKRLDAHPDVECFRKAKSASGLARPDFYDWIAEGKKQADLREPDLVVVIMGGNDGQDITKRPKSGDKRVAWDTDAWKAAYRERIDAFLAGVVAPGRKLLWLGLPKMGMRSLETKLETIRAVQREAIDALGEIGTYLDTVPFVTDEEGELLMNAKVGTSKKAQAIRADDRIHFTMSGSEYFAEKVYPEVLGALGMADAPAK
jgi:hypothetical protein